MQLSSKLSAHPSESDAKPTTTRLSGENTPILEGNDHAPIRAPFPQQEKAWKIVCNYTQELKRKDLLLIFAIEAGKGESTRIYTDILNEAFQAQVGISKEALKAMRTFSEPLSRAILSFHQVAPDDLRFWLQHQRHLHNETENSLAEELGELSSLIDAGEDVALMDLPISVVKSISRWRQKNKIQFFQKGVLLYVAYDDFWQYVHDFITRGLGYEPKWKTPRINID